RSIALKTPATMCSKTPTRKSYRWCVVSWQLTRWFAMVSADKRASATVATSASRASFINVADYLPAMARQQPETPAVLLPSGRDAAGSVRYVEWSFRQLEEESEALARGLEAIGIGAGVRTVLMVKPSLEFFALTFALFKVGAVPVLIDPGMGIRSLGR